MKAFFLILFYLPTLAYSQKPFKISGDVKELKDGDKIYLSYRSSGKLFKDSTIALEGKFSFLGIINSPSLGFISARENPFGDIEVLHNSIKLYIEPGNIRVSGRDSLKNAWIKGTKNNNDLSLLSHLLEVYKRRQILLASEFDALPDEHKSAERISDYRSANSRLLAEMEPIKLSFMRVHIHSYVSLATLKEMINVADIKKVASAYRALSKMLKETPEGKLLGEKILAAQKIGIGVVAPEFSLQDADDKVVSLSQFKRKYVLVDFWASWCLPCREENPNLKAVYEKFISKGFTVMSVSIDDQHSKLAWLEAVKKDDLTWTQLHDAKKAVHNLYGVTYIPANFLVDPMGKIIAINLKGLALQKKISELLL